MTNNRYTMGLFERDRYTEIYIIYDRELGYIKGREMELPGGSELDRQKAQKILDALNKAEQNKMTDTNDPSWLGSTASEHSSSCRFRLAVECSAPIECEHGYDVCPHCDPCTCNTGKKQAANIIEDVMQPTPENLEDAIEMCTELVLFGGGKEVFDRSEDEFMTLCHHNLGQRMRNAWGLWSMDSELFRTLAGETCLSHADDLSGLILTATYRKFNDLEFELLKEAAKYHNHWKQMFSGRGLSVVP